MQPIAKLRHRLTLEAPLEVPDGAGGLDESFTPLASLWGRLEPLTAEERVAAGRVEAAATHRVTIRQRDDITHRMRFSIGNRRFALKAIIGEERGRLLTCLCEEIVP